MLFNLRKWVRKEKSSHQSFWFTLVLMSMTGSIPYIHWRGFWGQNGPKMDPKRQLAVSFEQFVIQTFALYFWKWQGIPKSCGDVSPVYHPFRRAWIPYNSHRNWLMTVLIKTEIDFQTCLNVKVIFGSINLWKKNLSRFYLGFILILS